MTTWLKRLLDNNHKRLTAAALTTGALMFATLIGPFSDKTFYCFLVAFLGFSFLAINAANRKVNQILDEADGPDPFAMKLRVEPRDDCTYDLTIGFHWATGGQILRNLTRTQLLAKLAEHAVPADIATAEIGKTTQHGGLQLSWRPSTTDTTGETR
jgi:hypothetical protein